MSNVLMFTFSNTVGAGGMRTVNVPSQAPLPHASAALGGYDLVWALAPEALRAQLAGLQRCGKLPSEVLVGDLEETGLVIGGTDADRVRLGVPELTLDAAVPRNASLELLFTSGNMSFYNAFGKRNSVLKQSVAGWKLTFNVKLQLAPVSLDQALRGASADCARALMRFDPTRYRLHALSLDFDHSDLMHADDTRSVLGTDNPVLAGSFVHFIGAWLKGLAETGNAFVLGYAAVRALPGEDALSRLQAGSVSVAAAGTLNLLHMLGRKASSDGRGVAGGPGLAAVRPGHAAGCAARAVLSREVFFTRFLQPLLIDPIQERLNQLPDYRNLRVALDGGLSREESFNEKSGVRATMDNRARAQFVANAGGWCYRDHVRLHWSEGKRLSHIRASEQDLQFSVTVSSQPDPMGVPRLTVDLYSSLMRYEWDCAGQKIALFKRKAHLGKAWARSTMHWSMRLQFVADEFGAIRVTVMPKRCPVATDSGVVGTYMASDALGHLLNMNKLSNEWEGNPASLRALEQEVVAELRVAASELFSQIAGQMVLPFGPQPGCRSVQLNEDGNIELDLGC